jgi:hypothetical protein
VDSVQQGFCIVILKRATDQNPQDRMAEGLDLFVDMDLIAGFIYRCGLVYWFKDLGWHQIVEVKSCFKLVEIICVSQN